jgi:hypothetical protein
MVGERLDHATAAQGIAHDPAAGGVDQREAMTKARLQPKLGTGVAAVLEDRERRARRAAGPSSRRESDCHHDGLLSYYRLISLVTTARNVNIMSGANA